MDSRDTLLPRFVAHESWNFRLMTEVLLPAIVQSADILEANERTRRRDSSRGYVSLSFPPNFQLQLRLEFENANFHANKK